MALALANARGLHRVTTAEIAEAARINEGNLYYYFQRKAQIAEALFALFAEATLAVAERAIAAPGDPAAYADYQRGWFRLMWDFRAFYRDATELRAMAPSLREAMQSVSARGQEAVRRVFADMRAHGLMRASDAEIEALVCNIWIVSSYWMDFRGIEAEEELRPEDLAFGQRQVEALYAPYLTASGQAVVRAAAATGGP